MSKRFSGPWWSSLGLGKPADNDDDFGDMGTAFGLDASMAGPESSGSTVPGGLDSEPAVLPHDRIRRRFSL